MRVLRRDDALREKCVRSSRADAEDTHHTRDDHQNEKERRRKERRRGEYYRAVLRVLGEWKTRLRQM